MEREREDSMFLHMDKDLSTGRPFCLFLFTNLSLMTNTATLNTSKKNTQRERGERERE